MKVEVALIEVAVGCVGVIVGEEVDAAAGGLCEGVAGVGEPEKGEKGESQGEGAGAVEDAAGAESGIGWWRVEDLRAGSRA